MTRSSSLQLCIVLSIRVFRVQVPSESSGPPVAAPVDVLRLEVTAGPSVGAVFARPGELLTVGRTSKSKVHIKDAAVSEKHAVLAWEGGRWVLRDVGSSNGTAVNGKRVVEGARTQPARRA